MPILVPQTIFSDWDSVKLNTTASGLKRAEAVLMMLDVWKPPPFPRRPPFGRVSMDEIVDWIDRLDKGDQLNKSEREIYSLFTTWRQAVFHVEHLAASHLMVLLNAIRSIEKAEKDSGQLRDFIARWYGQKPPKVVSDANIRKLSNVLAQNLKLLPRALRV